MEKSDERKSGDDESRSNSERTPDKTAKFVRENVEGKKKKPELEKARPKDTGRMGA